MRDYIAAFGFGFATVAAQPTAVANFQAEAVDIQRSTAAGPSRPLQTSTMS